MSPWNRTALSPCPTAPPPPTAVQLHCLSCREGIKHVVLGMQLPHCMGREPLGGRKGRTPPDPNSAHLIGSDLLVNIRLLPDSVFQV